jgi:hypothetical protein
MKKYSLFLTELSKQDLLLSENFYEQQSIGLGIYFRNSLIADLDALTFYGGIHAKTFGHYRMLAKRFPYAIYYEVEEDMLIVHAILDLRKDPILHGDRLDK